MSPKEVRAAGGLVVHDGRVLVAHRPRYDDWSLPKGKLDPGETWERAALREIHEETGVQGTLGRELSSAHYTDDRGRAKTVRYWVMSPRPDVPIGPFSPNDEVDRIAWLTPAQARERLSYAHDRELLDEWAGGDAANPGTEIERKFLVAALPDAARDAPTKRIAQGYLTPAGAPAEVRVRRADDNHFLTIKGGDGLRRTEEELPIDRARFERLWPLTEGRRIEKVRHLIDYDGRTIELDVFGGARDGLRIAEVEFPSEDAARAWSGPDWLGEDVTDDPAYRNAALAG